VLLLVLRLGPLAQLINFGFLAVVKALLEVLVHLESLLLEGLHVSLFHIPQVLEPY